MLQACARPLSHNLSPLNRGCVPLYFFASARRTPMRSQCPLGVFLACGAVSVPRVPPGASVRGAMQCSPPATSFRGPMSRSQPRHLPRPPTPRALRLRLSATPMSSTQAVSSVGTGTAFSTSLLPGSCASMIAGLVASGSAFATGRQRSP